MNKEKNSTVHNYVRKMAVFIKFNSSFAKMAKIMFVLFGLVQKFTGSPSTDINGLWIKSDKNVFVLIWENVNNFHLI